MGATRHWSTNVRTGSVSQQSRRIMSTISILILFSVQMLVSSRDCGAWPRLCTLISLQSRYRRTVQRPDTLVSVLLSRCISLLGVTIMSEVTDLLARITPLDQAAIEQASQHQLQLTKPTGSLGRLEEIAVRMA